MVPVGARLRSCARPHPCIVLVFDPLVFIEGLAALVPPARLPQLTYHGVPAPAASWRDHIGFGHPRP
jgi:hypothetical protein